MRTLLAAFALLGGCALVQPAPKPAPPPALRELLSALTIGESTRTDARAALGDAVIVDFPNGYEVWVYRQKPPAAPVELVLLFDPSGVLAKTRVR